jgi:electron transfer flavoprotein beta subunit
MKILVPVKQVVDYNMKIRIKADGSGVELIRMPATTNESVLGRTTAL